MLADSLPPSRLAALEASREDNSHSQEKENYAICVGRLKIAVAKGTKWRKAAATAAAGSSQSLTLPNYRREEWA